MQGCHKGFLREVNTLSNGQFSLSTCQNRFTAMGGYWLYLNICCLYCFFSDPSISRCLSITLSVCHLFVRSDCSHLRLLVTPLGRDGLGGGSSQGSYRPLAVHRRRRDHGRRRPHCCPHLFHKDQGYVDAAHDVTSRFHTRWRPLSTDGRSDRNIFRSIYISMVVARPSALK